MKLFKVGVLVIHGFSSGLFDVENLVNDLNLDGKFDTFSFTLPGHKSKYLNRVTTKEYIKAADKQIKYLIDNGYNRIYVVGHSLGGLLALYLASKYKQVKKCVVVAPGLYAWSFSQYIYDIEHIIDTFTDPDSHYLKTLAKGIFISPLARQELYKTINKYRDVVKNITCDILLLHGDKDEVVPIKASYYAFDNVKSKHKKLVVIKDGRHNLLYGKKNKEIISYIHCYLKGGLKWILKNKEEL